jgi:chromosome partitioning protein
MGKIISVFSHKGGVGKTTFVHNLGYQLAKEGKKVILIDADPQTNLTSAVFGKSVDIDYNKEREVGKKNNLTEEQIDANFVKKVDELRNVWQNFFDEYRNLYEHFTSRANEVEHKKPLYTKEYNIKDGRQKKTFTLDLVAGTVLLAEAEREWYDIINVPVRGTRDRRPYLFRKSIEDFTKHYDFILIDTPPSSSSIISAMCVSNSDYFISPVVPNFFSFQSISNLQNIIQSWTEILKPHSDDGYQQRGLRLESKFLGVIVNRSKKRVIGANQYTQMTTTWSKLINDNLGKFLSYAQPNRAVTKEQFNGIFGKSSEPFIIDHIAQFPDRVVQNCDRAGVPMLCAEQASTMSKENKDTFKLIKKSYEDIVKYLVSGNL